MVPALESGRGAASRFSGRIDHRLSLLLASLLVLVVLLGGASLYLLGSLLRASDAIARQSEQVHIAQRVHATLQRFLAEVEAAHARGSSIPDTVRAAYATEMEPLLARYLAADGDPNDLRKIRLLLDEAGIGERGGTPTVGTDGVSRDEVSRVRATQRTMEALAERITAGHKAAEQRHVRFARQTVRLTIAVDLALVAGGAALLLAAQRYFQRAIGAPLRRLAACAADIATGASCEPMPVTSTDEIGWLTDAFNRMAQQLRAHEERLKGFATLEERQRLGRELHDSLAQDLALLRLELVEADRSLAPEVSAETKARVHEMVSTVDAGYQNLREAILGLRALDVKTSEDLMTTLETYVSDFSGLRKIPVELHASRAGVLRLSPHARTQLIRIVHEGLSNVARHAGASRATVTIETVGDRARVTIADDGRGFVPEAATRGTAHLGLRTMKERAESVGGTLAIRSAVGHGTQLVAELPMERA